MTNHMSGQDDATLPHASRCSTNHVFDSREFKIHNVAVNPPHCLSGLYNLCITAMCRCSAIALLYLFSLFSCIVTGMHPLPEPTFPTTDDIPGNNVRSCTWRNYIARSQGHNSTVSARDTVLAALESLKTADAQRLGLIRAL